MGLGYILYKHVLYTVMFMLLMNLLIQKIYLDIYIYILGSCLNPEKTKWVFRSIHFVFRGSHNAGPKK